MIRQWSILNKTCLVRILPVQKKKLFLHKLAEFDVVIHGWSEVLQILSVVFSLQHVSKISFLKIEHILIFIFLSDSLEDTHLIVQLIMRAILNQFSDVGQFIHSSDLPTEIFGIITAVAHIRFEQQAKSNFILGIFQLSPRETAMRTERDEQQRLYLECQ